MQTVPAANRPTHRTAAGAVALLLSLTGLAACSEDESPQSGADRNVILLIGDGLGDSEITVARNYLHGAAGTFPGIDALPHTGRLTTYSVDSETGKPDYTPDSAATGTAWATGVKTYDGAISVDVDGKAHPPLLQSAKRRRVATGNVTTAAIQDATPAVQVASVSDRACTGPKQTSKSCPENAVENGGSGSITEQLLTTRPDVTIGGGAKTFAQKARAGRWEGLTLSEQAQRRGYNYITDEARLAGVRAADQEQPLLAVMAPSHLPVKFAPSEATADGADRKAQTCSDNPDFNRGVSLPTLTDQAIKLLSEDRDGFFLQVESASIDKSAHKANACGQIGETEQLDLAVQKALQFAEQDGNTLVIVTGDHAQSSQIVGGNTAGLTTKLTTRDDAEMIVGYNTADGGKQQHTGSQLPVAAYGPGAGDVAGLIDQTELHDIISRSLNLD